MCIYEKIIENPAGKNSNKHGLGGDETLPRSMRNIRVGCGRCYECRNAKAGEWKVRLDAELRNNELRAWFITLTMSEESLADLISKVREDENKMRNKRGKGIKRKVKIKDRSWDENIVVDAVWEEEGTIMNSYGHPNNRRWENKVATKAMRLFLERWRKKFKESLRHWMITELGTGDTKRIHLHGIIWCPKEQIMWLRQEWKYGITFVGQYVNGRTIGYIVKYILKESQDKSFDPIVLTSPGIGKAYIEENRERHKFIGDETETRVKISNGALMRMPTYMKRHIYTEEERRVLWQRQIEKSKKEIWVAGNKITTPYVGLKGRADMMKKVKEATAWARIRERKLYDN